MPTPNETLTTIPENINELTRPSRLQLACPPEEGPTVSRSTSAIPAQNWRQQPAASPTAHQQDIMSQPQLSPTGMSDDEATTTTTTAATTPTSAVVMKQGDMERDLHSEPSPSLERRHMDHPQAAAPHGLPITPESPFTPSLSYEFSSKRLLPSSPCSFLRSGSKFSGKQTSDRSTYEVHVELKHVDMAESFLCGYLRIQGLTEDHPTLTTYFEGEMIGDKYTFQTRRPEWGSSEKNDYQHWARFPAYRPLASKAKRADFNYRGFEQKEHIFMRWKEYFLVPDHRVKQITGASFEGFYYICFNQITGSVSGIYFHAKSEKFQKLELKHVQDRCFGAVEFR
ncbi:unnamed protein product [Tuber aestivum]|uniref:Vesicle-mediated transport protein Vid24 n=1 Tax=Tuber aestivum TaxID=59557 RepID=A0A292PNL3_9PEZI|nr:unnamed protein product [Tuber aestivum]